jgi:hypothetical protein
MEKPFLLGATVADTPTASAETTVCASADPALGERPGLGFLHNPVDSDRSAIGLDSVHNREHEPQRREAPGRRGGQETHWPAQADEEQCHPDGSTGSDSDHGKPEDGLHVGVAQ